jgi:hypothetical protein
LGALSPDEQVLRQSDLKERFFEHLASLGATGQFILFDNADPPTNAASYAHVETFTNDFNQGRQGLLGQFPVATRTLESFSAMVPSFDAIIGMLSALILGLGLSPALRKGGSATVAY